MLLEPIVTVLALLIGTWLLVAGKLGHVRFDWALLIVGIVAVTAWSSFSFYRENSSRISEQEVNGRPIEVAADGYVTSTTCRACHPDQYHSWHASYHRTMTQVATPASVLGDFDSPPQEIADSLFRRDDTFYIRLFNQAGVGSLEYPIELTTGSHHYQAYWYDVGQGRRIKLVPVIYLIDQQKWIPREAAFLTPPSTTPATLRSEWNANCIKCHTTHGRPRVANLSGRNWSAHLDTYVAEFGISCEACHGPAEEHVSVNQSPWRRYQHQQSDTADPTIVQPARLDHRRSAEICGQCHSIFEFPSDEAILSYSQDGFVYRPGDELSRTKTVIRPSVDKDSSFMKELLARNPNYIRERFWSDGMVRVSGREYNGLIESPCYQHGDMSCLSCHLMHKPVNDPRSLKEWANDQLKRGMESNQACIQCHRDFEDRVEQHTHHPPNSSGSLCYNCHMPHTTYGLLKAIRSHQIDSPSVQASIETGRPNACNLCHLDKTLSWTSNYLNQWFGIPVATLSKDEQSIAGSLLWLLKGDAGQRALVAWSMGWTPAVQASGEWWIAPFLAQLLVDPYAAVRFIASDSLQELPNYHSFSYDFTGPQEQRAKALKRALLIWNEQHEQAVESEIDQSQILLHVDGSLNHSEIERLLQQRDNSPMNLAE